MKIGASFILPDNWRVTPVSEDDAPISITKVTVTTTQPDVAFLWYAGGDGQYELQALSSIVSQDGDPIEVGFNKTVFDLVYAQEDEGTIRLFDSVFGPLGISQRLINRRTMDELASERSLAIALDEQFRLRFQQLDDTVGRDGKPGKLRTV